MKRFGRLLLILFGYLLYTLCVVLILLWVMFPADSALVWVQGKLQSAYPGFTWRISHLDKVFPLILRLGEIQILGNNGENPLFIIDEVQVRPAFGKLIQLKETDNVSVLYDLKALDGTVKGEIQIPDKGQIVQCFGKMQGMELGFFEEIWKITNRTGSGTMSGTFQYSGDWQNPMLGNLEASVQIDDGRVSLLQPIFGMEQLDFHTLSTELTLRNKTLSLQKGQVDSKLLDAGYRGNIRLANNLYTSGINIQGYIEPRPEMLAGLKNATAATLIKSQLQDDKLSFTISGTLLEPGIQFRGVSGIIDGVIEGSGR